jgi:hypothetical protein
MHSAVVVSADRVNCSDKNSEIIERCLCL